MLQKGVYLYPNCLVMKIRKNGVYIDFQNDLVFLEADTVVLATGVQAKNELGQKIKSLVKEFYQIGDCVEPRDALAVIREGAEVGRVI
ncbi:MAG: hypothetical protein A3K30_03625 [Deltaproteobacteria bacterium RBG_13_51_10]|nr:MAG: hypothetical protein A3K30_03625 [Deltaproteobacteria bacterium RBG_13_51_10]